MSAWAARFALILGLAWPSLTLSQSDPALTAQRAAQMLDAAATSLVEADGARDRVEALTETVRAYEEGLLALREGIRRAAQREQTILVVFEAERDRLARLLGVLQTMERAPAPLLMLHPSGPVGTARSGMILSDVSPAIAREAARLQAQLEEIALLRALQDSALEQLSGGLIGAQDARSQLSQAIADRRVLPDRFELNTDAMLQLMESVDSLDSFAESLRAQPAETDLSGFDLPDFTDARGTLPLPVLGRVLRGFNDEDAAGITRPGLVLATQAQAMVTTPWPATVRYAGPLLDYGTVVILEPDGDYLLVLAGLADVFVRAGEVLSPTAPIGLMGGAPETSDNVIVTNAQGGGGDLSETLYIELREANVPVDPTEWFITE
ncbi:peptidoglycan DD-metalloendopeptidase family protein [Roseobacter sp. HKCCD9010]|uniref:murein hydrolase activator EnvC family protein n=1 Tax=unclassified Roseobacter TaxID=196798 RepID=UPI001491921E|nr:MULTISPECIES: peptidoglycan DD-metalloendopeptidase family protein [unclassified Roseobacter]MBF9051141.1 peptidoglycan DD-metalloendopeptidase family protein [Rhodobacterales bacterium HKCCD4356]NNV12910.1 peptidoglycan DD-metalloendopeptidase family protein [Roseobacter sp. HKCCD7357]NNV16855.1 peptidoglycan DD-metalloendopeptidase family protein [Roseobacter sp. HKCCD8768]NNV26513.1 peptidoglycan DD-metalloendopeptidase family protein [Roseobacter sp. HKCCD8192]NNV30576.1 peptidoglycan D